MKYKTSELIGAPLDFAVALALRKQYKVIAELPICFPSYLWDDKQVAEYWRPSTRGDHGTPVIEREHINITHVAWPTVSVWAACGIGNDPSKYQRPGAKAFEVGAGPTVLIAAMRAYVASKFGEEVDLP